MFPFPLLIASVLFIFFYLFGVFIKEVNVLWEVRKCNYLQKTNIIHQHVHPYRNVVGSNHYKMLNLLVFITCWTVAKLCLIYQEKLLRKSSLLIVLTYNLLVHCKWKLDVVAVFTHIFTHSGMHFSFRNVQQKKVIGNILLRFHTDTCSNSKHSPQPSSPWQQFSSLQQWINLLSLIRWSKEERWYTVRKIFNVDNDRIELSW